MLTGPAEVLPERDLWWLHNDDTEDISKELPVMQGRQLERHSVVWAVPSTP
jgi:hypothetical protein